jgi:hypothetical protein
MMKQISFLMSFFLLIFQLEIKGQEIINGELNDFNTVVVDNEAYSFNKNDTIYYPKNIIYSQDVRYVIDTLSAECLSSPGCIQIRPFDLYSAYFDLNYVVFNLNRPLIKGKTYVLSLSVKKNLNSDLKQSRLPRFDVKISNTSFENNFISYNDEMKIISMEGSIVNFSDTLMITNAYTTMNKQFIANGGETTLVFGCFFKYTPLGVAQCH